MVDANAHTMHFIDHWIAIRCIGHTLYEVTLDFPRQGLGCFRNVQLPLWLYYTWVGILFLYRILPILLSGLLSCLLSLHLFHRRTGYVYAVDGILCFLWVLLRNFELVNIIQDSSAVCMLLSCNLRWRWWSRSIQVLNGMHYNFSDFVLFNPVIAFDINIDIELGVGVLFLIHSFYFMM